MGLGNRGTPQYEDMVKKGQRLEGYLPIVHLDLDFVPHSNYDHIGKFFGWATVGGAIMLTTRDPYDFGAYRNGADEGAWIGCPIVDFSKDTPIPTPFFITQTNDTDNASLVVNTILIRSLAHAFDSKPTYVRETDGKALHLWKVGISLYTGRLELFVSIDPKCLTGRTFLQLAEDRGKAVTKRLEGLQGRTTSALKRCMALT